MERKASIKVWFNPGEDANTPWHVGLHDGVAIAEHFARCRTPRQAAAHAVAVSKQRRLTVDLPQPLQA